MITKRLREKLVQAIADNRVLDERLRYDLRLRTNGALSRHCTIQFNAVCGDWQFKFENASGMLFRTEAQAVEFIQSFELSGFGRVTKVACACPRCNSDELMELLKLLEDVSHGACDEHLRELEKQTADLKPVAKA